MARVAAVLKALYTAFRRDWRSFGSIGTNQFFPVTLFFLRQAGVFLYLLAAVVVLFPMSSDPLRKIPRSRLDSWPLTPGDRRLLRLASPWLNPVTWGLAALAIWAARGRITIGLCAIAAAVFLAGFALSELPVARGVWFWRRVPGITGPLNQLVRKNVREIVSTLDFYVAVLISAAAGLWRAFGLALPREAYLEMALLALLALSTYSQCLFGLDGDGGFSRYRLLPLRAWQILAAKDIAFLAVAALVTLPLAPLPGIGAALVCLASGHGPSIRERRSQTRWRFSSGQSLYFGFVQVLLMAGAAAGIEFASAWLVIACAAACAGSLWVHGKSVSW